MQMMSYNTPLLIFKVVWTEADLELDHHVATTLPQADRLGLDTRGSYQVLLVQHCVDVYRW